MLWLQVVDVDYAAGRATIKLVPRLDLTAMAKDHLGGTRLQCMQLARALRSRCSACDGCIASCVRCVRACVHACASWLLRAQRPACPNPA